VLPHQPPRGCRRRIDGNGTILIVEVEPDHRRKGVATRLLAELEAAGYSVVHDWENMRDDGESVRRGP
jgi:GNAT superfamily N-acetyltransferase